MKKIFSFSNKRTIWRILLTPEKGTSASGDSASAQSHLLVIEERDTVKKEAFFSGIRLETGKVLFKSFRHEEPFWVGIEAVAADAIYFHTYQKPNLPQHKGISAYSIPDMKLLWKNETHNFLFLYENDVYCFQQMFEDKRFYSLDAETGEVKSDFASDIRTISDRMIRSQQEAALPNAEFPKLMELRKIIEEFPPLLNAPSKKLFDLIASCNPAGSIEFLFKDPFALAAFHLKAKDLLNQRLIVFDTRSSKIVFDDVLHKKIESPVLDTFFLNGSFLILLRQKTGVEVYSLE